MKALLLSIIELLFPPTEDEVYIAKHTPYSFVQKYNARTKNTILLLTPFADSTVRSAIHLNKFHAHPHAKKLLAAVLEKHLQLLPVRDYLIIPIPLSKQREKQRGYNQVTEVLKTCTQISIPFAQDILVRTRNTPPQTSLSKKERLSNLKGAFIVSEQAKATIAGAHLILIDDVVTTGSTFREAKSALLPYKPASITCIALAG